VSEAKSEAIIYAGYEYQTLHGVRVLVKWLNDPLLYKRVCIEADDSEKVTPQGIDDIVCERTDGKFDYQQVKFTNDVEKHLLTWDWLIYISGTSERSRSIIKKIFDAVSKISEDKLGDVLLVTNRKPDRKMYKCLNDGKVIFNDIPQDIQNHLIEKMGSKKSVTYLFSKLHIAHSQKNLTNLDIEVTESLKDYSSEDCINRLKNEARRWAIIKNSPNDKSWISLNDIKAVLSNARPKPIPQDFLIPDNYSVPDEGFHNTVLQTVIDISKKILVISGPPGRGKSTYLSFLTNQIESAEIPIIRHHYFLSVDDHTSNRFRPQVVKNGLLFQAEGRYKDGFDLASNKKELYSVLKACGQFYKEKNKPFVVVFDGLDHVWRDNDKDKRPLDELFNSLIPAPDNVIYLFGTQPVDEELLPTKLIKFQPKDTWLELPPMNEKSIYDYLKVQIAAKRLKLAAHSRDKRSVLNASTKALYMLTKGHPLHVIYSTEYLIANDLPLLEWQIKKLPKCEGETITSYYNSLWKNLTYQQQDIIHLCCEFLFYWDKFAFHQMNAETSVQDVNGVIHLLYDSSSGVRPFHESLNVFVKGISDHKERIEYLLPSVCSWLKDYSPVHTKDIWYFQCLARQQEPLALIENIDRDWLLDKLSRGYSLDELESVLNATEKSALKVSGYAKAHHFRGLKMRLINGPEFQTNNKNELTILSYFYAPQSLLLEYLTSFDLLSTVELCCLAIALHYKNDETNASNIALKALKRYQNEIKLINGRDDHGTLLIRALALTETYEFTKDKIDKWPDEYLRALVDSYCEMGSTGMISELCLTKPEDRKYNSYKAFLVSLKEEEDLAEYFELDYKLDCELVAFLGRYIEGMKNPVDMYSTDIETTNFPSVNSYSNEFFSSINFAYNASGEFTWLPIKDSSGKSSIDRADRTEYLNVIREFAVVSYNYLSETTEFSLEDILYFFSQHTIECPTNHWESTEFDNFNYELIEIAIDLSLVINQTTLSKTDFDLILSNKNFNFHKFIHRYQSKPYDYLSDEAVKLLLNEAHNVIDSKIGNTSELCESNLQLASIAFRHKFYELAEKRLHSTWEFVIGYGYHKDSNVLTLLESINHIGTLEPKSALSFVKDISPQIKYLDEFTDGDGASHAIACANDILASYDLGSLALKYAEETYDGEAYRSEQSLSSMFSKCELTSSIIENIVRTGISEEIIQILTKRSTNGDLNALKLVNIAKKHNGTFNDIDKVTLSKEKEETTNLDFSKYRPEKFNELTELLKKDYSSKNLFIEWLDFWVQQGRVIDLLKYTLPEIIEHNHYRTEELLDRFFELKRKKNGKRSAFKLLVLAHERCNGWSEYGSSMDSTKQRLDKLVKYYPERIDEFLALTMGFDLNSRECVSELILPHDRLVYLLASAGRIDEALALVSSLVSKFKDETRSIVLPIPVWAESDKSCDELAWVITLIARIHIPVSSVKWWVCQELALLLVNKSHSKLVEEKLLNELSIRNLESEVVEIIAVFVLASQSGYQCSLDLGDYIKARSVLSDLLLKKYQIKNNLGTFKATMFPMPLFSEKTSDYIRADGTDLPGIFLMRIKKIGEMSGYPIEELYQSNWQQTKSYEPIRNSSVDYYLNYGGHSLGTTTGNLFTQTSHRGRSAYLRVLKTMFDYFGAPESMFEDDISKLLPFDPSLINIKPIYPPWLENIELPKDNNESSIIKFISEMTNKLNELDENLIIGAIGLSIQVNENSFFDLEIRRFCKPSDDSDSILDDRQAQNFYTGGLVDDTSIIDVTEVNSKGYIPLVTDSFRLPRISPWHSDINSRGLFTPRCQVEGNGIKASSENGLLKYRVNKINIGYFGYANNRWQANFIRESKANCITFTILNKQQLDFWVNKENLDLNRHCLVCKVKSFERDSSYGEYTHSENVIII
jgi:hypothetical protein